MTDAADDGNWHLDKKVPISIIAALVLNASAGVWYAAKMDNRVGNLEGTTARLETTQQESSHTANDNNTRLIRVEDKLDNLVSSLQDLKNRFTGQRPQP